MIDDQTFQTKFHTVVDIFKEWMPKNYDYSRSTILDFGCEHGVMTLGMALKLRPRKVIGVDINDYHAQLADIARRKGHIQDLPGNLEFHQVEPVENFSREFSADVIFTWSTFEHVNQPNLGDVVAELHDCLAPSGYLFLQVAPLYYSAFGSHLETLLDEPWAHLSMQNNLLRHRVMTTSREQTIYKDENDDNYEAIKASIWSCYETLNKVTADQLVALFEKQGFVGRRQLRTHRAEEPPPALCDVFMRDVLTTEQLVVLFQKADVNSHVGTP